MSDTTAPEEPGVGPNAGRIPSLLVPLVVAAGLGVVGLFVWAAVSPGVWHDDGAYLLLGKSLTDGEGLRYSQVPGSLPGAVQLQASWAGGMLVRLDWDDACREVVVPGAVPGA